MEETSAVTADQPKPSQKDRKLRLNASALIIVLLIGAGLGAYWWRDQSAKKAIEKQQAETAQIQALLTKAEQDLAAEKAKSSAAPSATPPPSTAETDENIAAAINSGNTAALESYMASTIRVIIAASEGVGDRTPAQAIADLAYLDSATEPWDFSLPSATLDGYSSGDYAMYFPAGALVGRSEDDKVVAFTFNGAGKIDGIFMAANADLL